MQCSGCGFLTLERARFCSQCGMKLHLLCEGCGSESPTGSRFCDGCGAPLSNLLDVQRPDHSTSTLASGAPNHEQRPERRQVTVLFIDMVGSTDMSVHLDEEDFRDVIYSYRDTCANAVRRFDGTIVRYIGDGLLVCFGFPVAHEDDPARAVRAALSLLSDMRQLNSRGCSGRPPIRVRMGIHTGIVIAGDLRSSGTFETMGILGDTPNIASRLQQIAPPDKLVISETTARLILNLFDLHSVGPHEIRGTQGTINLYEVVAERSDLNRDAPRAAQMVGRRQELALLQDRFIQTVNGEGQLVFITAEAGAGKTRLVRDFKDTIVGTQFLPVTCYCSAYNQSSAFYPIIDLIRRALNLDSLGSIEDKLASLRHSFAGLESVTPDALPLITELLELPASSSTRELAPSQRRELLLDVLTHWLLRQSEQLPVLFIVEDLHWADASTSSLLARVIQRISAWRVMAIFTFRPEFKAEWLLEPHGTRLGLRRLSPNEARTLVEQIVGEATIPTDVVDLIITKTGGIPLFIEELTKTVLECNLSASNDESLQLASAVDSIPSTLRGSLAARLDRLKIAKPLAQVAATLGRVFGGDVLGAVTGESQAVLREQLAELLREGFLHQHGNLVNAKYSFRHALIQDAAYDSLLKSERQLLHRKIADVLSIQFPAIRGREPH
jgi:class 3 adenylate cyclase